MGAPKRPTHVVAHKKLYMAVEGKLQHMKQGTELVLSDKVAEKLGKKVRVMGEEDAVDLTETGSGTGTDFSKMKVEELKAELTKAGISFADGDKKADLLKLLEKPTE